MTTMKPTVLLVEDNYPLRRLLARELKQSGFRVVQADNLEHATTVMREPTTDGILCDVELSGGVALDFMIEARSRGIPVIAMSASDKYRAACENVGVVAFLQKPILTRHIAEHIQTMLSGAARLG